MPRSILVKPSSRAVRSRPWLRRRLAPLTAAALATLALAAPATTPAHAFDQESYMRCVNTVANWTDNCKTASLTLAGDLGCLAAGTVGILGCAALEAIEQLGKGISLQ
ncbi:MAG TPA: hypothetical protein VFX39_04230 [Gemmatimonadaceae bacterium]|nr:hypothetical protein [Gemmatimonadaceae bacterium]